jgi:hypothetical protein
MATNTRQSENELLEAAVLWLRERLPPAWSVKVRSGDKPADSSAADVAIEISGGSVFATLAVQARRVLGPRDVQRLFGSFGKSLRTLSPQISLLVVAPWLSPRTRELLEVDGLNYVDLSGNALVRLNNPAVYIRSDGAARAPSPAPRAKARLRGAKAARLIRTLLDVQPPYGVRELAGATGIAPGYVSQVLEALSEDAFIERSKRGRVESVDVGGLINRWSEEYEVFRSNDARRFVAPGGAAQALAAIAERPDLRVAVTGSFAAVRLAPVAAPALLCLYSARVDLIAEQLGMFPADDGANVLLLLPYDPVVWDRASVEEGVRYVASSQAVVDCLTGNGRMPAEGEALRRWMVANEARWRRSSLEAPDA